jgi:type IV pilus assembly protein PilY1
MKKSTTKLTLTFSSKLLMLVSTLSLFGSLHLSVHAQTSLSEDLRQEPITINVKTAPNVILMMDDSQSMMGDRLPPPPGINWSPLVSFPDFRSFANNSGSTTQLDQSVLQGNTTYFNPIWYNPAITYKPWNDNNKPAATNFPNSKIGTIVGTNVVDQTRLDMRFRTEAGVKVEVDLVVTDPFRRYGTRQGPVCIKLENVTYDDCTGGWTPWVQSPDPSSESGYKQTRSCLGYTSKTENVCTEREKIPNLIDGRYMRFEGSGPADITDQSKYRLVEIDRDDPARMYPSPIDPYTGVQVQRPDCANPLNCTFTEEAQNFANYWTYYRNRLFAAIAVTSQVLADVDEKIRVGYGRLNYFANGAEMWPGVPSSKPPATLPTLDGQPNNGHIVRGVRPFTVGSVERQELFTWLFGLNGVGGTPIREAMDAMGKYYSRPDVRGPWAAAPGIGDAIGAPQLACRRNFSIVATDGSWTDSVNHPRLKDLYPGLLSGTPAQSDSVIGPSITGSGSQTGKAYQYSPTNEPFFGTSAGQNETLTDVAMHYWNNDLRPDLANVNKPTAYGSGSAYNYPKDYENPATWQTMTNFIVGYGLQPSVSISSAKAAMVSGTAFTWPNVNVSDAYDSEKLNDTLRAALASRGDFFTAQSPTELAASLKKVFSKLGSTQGASGTLALSSQVITSVNDLIYEASYDTSNWNGSLRAIGALDAIAGKPKSVWTANFPAKFTDRVILSSTAKNTPIDFRWAQLTPSQQTSLGSQAIFDYLIGDRSAEAQYGGTLRERGSILGSIVTSSPLYSGSTHFGYQYQPGTAGTEYPAYLDFKRNTRKASVIVGSNGGMLHAFDAKTGLEQFAYTPRAAIPEMNKLASPSYVHQFLVDGLISEGDAYLGGKWGTYVLGSSGAGPKSLFLLDTTNPDAMTSAKVKWEITEQNEDDLGHVLGGAIIAPTLSGKWVVLVGNGYESKKEQAALLAFDLNDGSLVKKIGTGTGSKANKAAQNGLGPVTPIYDGKRNVIAVYGGDKLGNLWRFDLSDVDPNKWRITTSKGGLKKPVFTAKDGSGAVQPITSAPRIASHPMGGLYIVFGTGKAFNIDDITNKQVQSIYGIRDKDNSGPYLKTDMLGLTLKDVPGDYRQLDGLTGPTGLNWAKHNGWYFDLTTTGIGGERVMNSPRLVAGMLTMASFNPENPDPCDAGGKTFIYSFDLSTDFSRPAFNGQPTSVIGARAPDGVVGALASLYAPAVKSTTPKNSIDLATLKSATKDTRYSVTGGILKDNSAASFCALSANSINNLNVTVPTACAGTTPLRVWRDLR